MSQVRLNFLNWQPDRDEFQNEGLTECQNTVHDSEGYKSSKTAGDTLISSSTTAAFLEALPWGGAKFAEANSLWAGVSYNAPGNYVQFGTVGNWGEGLNYTGPAGATTASLQCFAAVEVPGDAMLVSGQFYFHTAGGVGSTTPASGLLTYVTDYGIGFGSVKPLPNSAIGVVCGVINAFACVGNENATSGGTFVDERVTFRWSAIGDASDWPIPATDDARSKQAGQQILNSKFGQITGIAGGDFYGYVFQEYAITKVTYVGGDVVFTFDTFEEVRGCGYLNRLVQVDDRVYYESKFGRHYVENDQVLDIGYGRVDDTHTPDTTDGKRLYVNPSDHLVFFSNSIVYNYQTDQFSYLPNITPTLSIDKEDGLIGQSGVNGTSIYLYDATNGTAETATLTTGSRDVNEGGRAVINGVRPLISGGDARVSVIHKDILNPATRTNDMLRTEDLSTLWSLNNVTISADATAAPDGQTTADQMLEDAAATEARWVLQSITHTSAVDVCISAYAKAGTGVDWLSLYAVDTTHGGGSDSSWFFDLTNGVLGSAGTGDDDPISYGMESAGNGWYRCWISVGTSGTATDIRVYQSDTDATISYVGAGSQGIYVWGVMVEEGVYTPGGYIKSDGTKGTSTESSTLPLSTNSRSGYANFRDEGRYHKAKITIEGGFTTALGADVDFSEQGEI